MWVDTSRHLLSPGQLVLLILLIITEFISDESKKQKTDDRSKRALLLHDISNNHVVGHVVGQAHACNFFQPSH